MDTLFNMKKGVKEPLRAYIKRFQSKLLYTKGYNERTINIAFKRGLLHTSKLHQLLTKTPTEDMMRTRLLARAKKFAKLEDETLPQGTVMMNAPLDL